MKLSFAKYHPSKFLRTDFECFIASLTFSKSSPNSPYRIMCAFFSWSVQKCNWEVALAITLGSFPPLMTIVRNWDDKS